MRVIHLIVFACLSIGSQSRYHFRFHTCYREDQEILVRESLLSLYQVAFIDDGALVYHDVVSLEKAGIEITGPSGWNGSVPGAESALRIVNFRASDHFLVINFWSRTYYFKSKKRDRYTMETPKMTVKPSLDHFVRVYFVCAPGNSRSALILFGGQNAKTKARKSRSTGDEEDVEDLENLEDVDNEDWDDDDVDMDDDDSEGVAEEDDDDGEDEYENDEDVPKVKTKRDVVELNDTSEIEKMKAKSRSEQFEERRRLRSILYYRKALAAVHTGFSFGIAINALLVAFFLWKKRTPLPVEVVKKEPKKDATNPSNATTTTMVATVKKEIE